MNEILKAKIRSALETGWQFLPDLSNGTVTMHHPGSAQVAGHPVG